MEAKDTDSAISAEIERHAQELDEFRAVLNRSFSVDQVSKWTRIAALRPLGATHSIWGSVRWRKALGKAIGTPLAAGLIIECTVLQSVWGVDQNGVEKEYRLYFPGHPVLTWEITNSESYAVGFWTTQIPGRTHQIKVRLAPNVPWEQLSGSAALTIRLIEPPAQEFEAVNSTRVLPPFSIISAGLRPEL